MNKFMQSQHLLIIICFVALTKTVSTYSIQTKKQDASYKSAASYVFNFKDASSYEFDSKQELTCFTCDKSKSNDECNRKAIDEPCSSRSANATISNFACMTIHKLNAMTLKTISIEKKCTLDCKPSMVGCSSAIKGSTLNDEANHEHIRTCTYCCNKNYCNLDASISTKEALELSYDFISNSAKTLYIKHEMSNSMLIVMLFIMSTVLITF